MFVKLDKKSTRIRKNINNINNNILENNSQQRYIYLSCSNID